MERIVEKLHPEIDAVMQWHTQAGNITTNHKVKLDFTYPHLAPQIPQHENIMWMTLLRVYTI